jgi:phenylacetate-CoA ligase
VSRQNLSLNSALYKRLPIFAQNVACSASGWMRFRSRFNRHFHSTLAEWEANADLSLDELQALQFRRLSKLVLSAREHVPYYRDLAPPVEKSDPQQAIEETLASIPPLEKTAYRDQPSAFLSRAIPRLQRRQSQTSGTTGTALPLWHTSRALAEEYAAVWRMRRTVGAEVRDPHLSFNGQIIVPIAQKKPPFYRVNHHGGQVLFSIYHMMPENLESYVDAIHAEPAKYVQGYPSAIHIAARALLEANRPMEPGRLKAVFTSSESLLAFQREAIEAGFGAPIRDRYGVSEFVVSMTECEEKRLHVDMEFGIVEVDVVEETDDSETGPLLVTGLAPHATPRFRYRIGDVGTRAKTPCPCGRVGDSFFDIDGRVEDYVLTPDGRLIGRMDHVFKKQLDVAEAQIVQETAAAIEVLVVPRPGYSTATEQRIVREIRDRLGGEIGVTVSRVSEIPRESNGKFRAVKSLAGQSALQSMRRSGVAPSISPPEEERE